MNVVRKYLSYIIFGGVVLVVLGLAISHSTHLRALVGAMSGNDRQAQASAAAELIKGEQFMDSITGESTEVRVKAAEALESLGDEKAVKQTLALLKDNEQPVRDRAILTLQHIGGKNAANIKALADGIGDTDPYARKGLMAVFTADNGGVGPLPDLIRAVVDKMKADGNSRQLGGDILGSPRFIHGDANKISIPLLVALLGDSDEGVRSAAAEALGKIGDPAAIDPLKAKVNDTAQVRRIVIGALALIANSRSEDILMAAVRSTDDDNEARAQAATGLGKIATPEAITTLVASLNDDDLKLRSAAVTALALAARPKLNGPTQPQVMSALLTALHDKDEDTRLGAARALTTIASPEANSALLAIIQSSKENVSVRQAAVKALGFADNQAAVAGLIQQLSDPVGEIGLAARDSLAAIGPSATNALIAVMAKGDTDAYYAAQALAKFGSAALPALDKLSQRTDTTSQRWAAVALGDLGVPEARPLLSRLEKSTDPDVSFVAKQQLARIGRAQ